MQRRTFFGFIILGLAVRAILAPLSAHPFDSYVYFRTSQMILQGQNFYGVTDYSYPPLWAGFIAIASAIYSPLAGFFGAHPMPVSEAQQLLHTQLPITAVTDWLFEGLVKLPLIAFDTLLALLLFRIVDVRFRKPDRAAVAALLFYLNPLVIWISSIWGTFDVLPTYFAILGSLLFMDRRGYASGLAFGVAIGFKYYPVLVLLVLVLGLRRREDPRTTKETLLATALVLVAISVPFLMLDPGSYVHGVLSPAGGVFVGNLSIWVLLSEAGVRDIPGWIASVDILFVVAVVALFAWISGSAVGAHRDPALWVDLIMGSLLIFYVFFRIVNDQYVFWIMPILALEVTLGRERLVTILGASCLVVVAGLVNVPHYSFFLQMLTISPGLAGLIPPMWNLPSLRVALSLLFWAFSVVMLLRLSRRLMPRGLARATLLSLVRRRPAPDTNPALSRDEMNLTPVNEPIRARVAGGAR